MFLILFNQNVSIKRELKADYATSSLPDLFKMFSNQNVSIKRELKDILNSNMLLATL